MGTTAESRGFHEGIDVARSTWATDLTATSFAVVVTKLRGLAAVFLVGAAYGLDAVGAFAFLYAAQSLLVLIAVPGLHFLIVTETPHGVEERGRHLSAIVAIGLGTSGLVAAAWFLVATRVDAELITVVGEGPFAWFGVTVIGMAGEFLGKNYHRLMLRIRAFALLPALRMAIEILLIALWGMRGSTVGSLVVALIGLQLFWGLALLAPLLFEETLGRPRGGDIAHTIRRALPLGGGQLASDALARGDRIILAPLVSASALGIYAASYAIASLTYAASPALVAVVYPRLGARFRHATTATLRTLDDFRLGFMVITTASVAVLGLASPSLAAVMRLSEGVDVLVVVVLACAGILYADSQMTVLPLVWSLERRRVWTSQAAGALLSLAALPVATVRFGLVGASTATFLGYLTTDVMASRRRGTGPLGISRLTALVLATAVMMLVLALTVGVRGAVGLGGLASVAAGTILLKRRWGRRVE